MNFLLRPAQTAAATAGEQPSVSSKYMTDANYASKDRMTLGGVLWPKIHICRILKVKIRGKILLMEFEVKKEALMGASSKSDTPIVENHINVAEDEGWITIPYSTSSLPL